MAVTDVVSGGVLLAGIKTVACVDGCGRRAKALGAKSYQCGPCASRKMATAQVEAIAANRLKRRILETQ
jgi:tRNA(Ile2) C34 agmatinyltransferase TiaS